MNNHTNDQDFVGQSEPRPENPTEENSGVPSPQPDELPKGQMPDVDVRDINQADDDDIVGQ